jgi:MinD-like ATPase involved in chromosome partitioning or flagellar assembly
MLQIGPRSILGRVSQKSQTGPIVIAVSSAHGSQGKTTVAINLALELASERARVLLIDGDLSASSIANHFLLSDLPAGLPGAIRVANQNRFDIDQLERLTLPVAKSTLVIMPGFSSTPETEVETHALERILETAKANFEYTVIDLGSLGLADLSLVAEQFTETVFGMADKKLVVCLADPIGIFRLLATEHKVLELASDSLLLMNRVRNSVIPAAKREIAITLQRLSQLEVACYLPDDPQQIDQAIRTGVPAVSLSRSGLFRQAITGFVRAEILGSKGQLDSRVAKLG